MSTADPDRKRAYETVRGIIEHNTGGPSNPQRAGIRRPTIGGIASHANIPPERVETALRALCEQREVLQYPDEDGQRRYCLWTRDGLQAVVAQHNAEGIPPTDVIETRVVPALQEVGDE